MMTKSFIDSYLECSKIYTLSADNAECVAFMGGLMLMERNPGDFVL